MIGIKLRIYFQDFIKLFNASSGLLKSFEENFFLKKDDEIQVLNVSGFDARLIGSWAIFSESLTNRLSR